MKHKYRASQGAESSKVVERAIWFDGAYSESEPKCSSEAMTSDEAEQQERANCPDRAYWPSEPCREIEQRSRASHQGLIEHDSGASHWIRLSIEIERAVGNDRAG